MEVAVTAMKNNNKDSNNILKAHCDVHSVNSCIPCSSPGTIILLLSSSYRCGNGQTDRTRQILMNTVPLIPVPLEISPNLLINIISYTHFSFSEESWKHLETVLGLKLISKKEREAEAEEKGLPCESIRWLGKETQDLVIHSPWNTRKSDLERKHTERW